MPFHPEDDLAQLLQQFNNTRQYSIELCQNLNDEDLQAQSMLDASPLKWHLAHTSWAFETFVLKPFLPGYEAFDPSFEYLFNSYYNAIGKQYPRAQRGLLTRPTRIEVNDYRNAVNSAMTELIAFLTDQITKGDNRFEQCISLICLTINHEQQHQELMLTDLKHLFSFNPNNPIYSNKPIDNRLENCEVGESIEFNEGLYTIGHQDEAFYFDNEGPPHQVYLNRFKLEPMLVSNAEYLEFMQDGGYQKPQYWLSEAWQTINSEHIKQPIYWQKIDQQWYEYSFNGLRPLEPLKPIKHISYFEACAFALWKNKRLPTEQEWEVAARSRHPKLKQMFDQLWQWTSSSYCAYPGFKAETGAIGEYNGKFMVNQYVLKGGSIVTPTGHIRPSYRNFFYPGARWQFSGVRLAESY